MMTIVDLLNQLSARTASAALTDAEAVALSDGLAELTAAIMRRPVLTPADLLDKIAVIRTCVARQWDALLPAYLEQVEADLRKLSG